MDFGLGLVLSFTDNATAGINNAVNSLNNLTNIAENASASLNQMASLSALSVVANKLGNSFLSAGQGIISTLGQVIQKVNDVGGEIFYADTKLSKLYEGSGRTGRDVLNDISQYAQESIFEYKDLIDVVAMLKANGIEAFDDIASSTGNSNQKLMDYAADLASFNPQMKNAYGTGIKAAMGALNEYIAEGNARSLKSGASLDITGILGEDKGATIEERSRQVADLMEKLNLVGMTASMAGTPMQRLSNVQDLLFTSISKIADSGVYDKYVEIIQKATDWIFSLSEAGEDGKSVLDKLIPVIGDTLISIMTPIEKLIDKVLKLADSFTKFLANNPSLMKFATIGASIAGVLLMLSGVVLKATSAFSDIALVLLSMGKSFKELGGIIRTGSLKVLGTLIPLIAMLGMLALAWKIDFAGIKTNTTYFLKGITDSFKTAKNAVNDSVEGMTATLENLRSKGDFFSNLTIGIMKLMILFRALKEGWNDYTLSEDTFLKAKELGILPLIEAILDLKYRFDFFKQGFIDGWREIGEKVKTAVMGFLDNVDGTFLEDMVNDLTDFLQKLASGDTDAWYQFGQSFADFTAKAIAFWVVFKVVDSILGKLIKVTTAILGIGKVFGIVKTIGGGLAKMFHAITKFGTGAATIFKELFTVIARGGQGVSVLGKLAEVLKAVFAGGMKLKDAMTIVFGGVSTAVASVVAIVGGAVLAVFNFVSMIKNGFSWIKEIFMVVGIAIATVGAILAGIAALPAVIVGAIIAAVATLAVVIHDHWESICSFFTDLGTAIGSFFKNIFTTIGNFFKDLPKNVSRVVDNVVGFVKSIPAKVSEVISTVGTALSTFLFTTVPYYVGYAIGSIGGLIVNFFTVTIPNAWNAFIAWGASVIQTLENFFIVTIPEFFSSCVSAIANFFTVTVPEFFSGLWSTICEWGENVKNFFSITIPEAFGNFVDKVGNFLTITLPEKFQSLLDKVRVWKYNFLNFFKELPSKLFEIGENIMNSLRDGLIKAWENVKSAIGNFVKGITDGFKGAKADVSVNATTTSTDSSGAKTSSTTTIPAMASGGIVSSPIVSLVGEAGKEAVVPLENNLGWLTTLASELSDRIIPTNSHTSNTANNDGSETPYMTPTSTNNSTISGDTDNSVTFKEGAVQITAQNASDEEALRLAKKIMEYIKRQKELESMANYA